MIVNRSKALARYAFMHCIMSSLCFWLSAILHETMDSVLSKKYFYKKKYCTEDDDYFRADGEDVQSKLI